MNMFLTTENLDPNKENLLGALNQNLLPVLPADYVSFLQTYGTGTYCDEIFIHFPDSENISNTFRDYTDLWDLNDSFDAGDLLQATQLATTANGDIICGTAGKQDQVFILPRRAEEVISTANFLEALNFFVPQDGGLYFDPDYDQDKEQLRLTDPTGSLVDIAKIHQLFLQQFSFDFAVKENTQPKYFFKSFGGWVSFDLIYKNTINLKLQKQHRDNAKVLLTFLKKNIV